MELAIIISAILILGINSLEIFGFYAACEYEEIIEQDSLYNPPQRMIPDPDSKEIFWFIKFYSKKWLGDYLTKPICGCAVCMSSLHSLWVWLPVYYFMPFTWILIYLHAAYMLALCGLNKLILSKVDL